MRLFEEIVARLGLDEEIASGEKFVVFPDRCAYFENVKAILSFSSSAAEIACKSGVLRAEGEELRVGYYCGGELALFGKVTKIEKMR